MSKIEPIKTFIVFKGKTGIYKFRNINDEKVYIGQAKDIYKRLAGHIYRASYKEKFYIHQAINKYGIENFDISVVELCLEEHLDNREQYWIDFYGSFNREKGYNLAPTASSMRGYKMPESGKKKMSEKRIAYFKSHREEAMENGIKLKATRTPEVEARRIESVREYYRNNPHPSKGSVHKEETKEKIRQGMLKYRKNQKENQYV